MKIVSLLVAASVLSVSAIEDSAHSMPNHDECYAVDAHLQIIAQNAGDEAVKIDAIRMGGLDHLAGAHVKKFEDARADAVNALMDFLAAADGLARQFKTFCR